MRDWSLRRQDRRGSTAADPAVRRSASDDPNGPFQLSFRAGDVHVGWPSRIARDRRDRVGVGLDDMGGNAANRLTVAGSGLDGAVLGANGGAQAQPLSIAQWPSPTRIPESLCGKRGRQSRSSAQRFGHRQQSGGQHDDLFDGDHRFGRWRSGASERAAVDRDELHHQAAAGRRVALSASRPRSGAHRAASSTPWRRSGAGSRRRYRGSGWPRPRARRPARAGTECGRSRRVPAACLAVHA